jgi:hypothetical protein
MHTPAVMLTRWRFGMAQLPAHKLTKPFRLLLAHFSIADTRLRALHCKGGCSHTWHHLRGAGGRSVATLLARRCSQPPAGASPPQPPVRTGTMIAALVSCRPRLRALARAGGFVTRLLSGSMH